MTEAIKDNNNESTLLATSADDGVTPVLVKADPNDHTISLNDDTTGSDLSRDDATRDDNSVPVLLATSSSDGITPVPVYANASGELLVNSN